MADIYDIQHLKRKRVWRAIRERLRKVKKIEPSVDICNAQTRVTGYVFGTGGPTAHDQLRLIVYDTSGPAARPVVAIRMRREQWEALKDMGDLLLGAHGRLSKPDDADGS